MRETRDLSQRPSPATPCLTYLGTAENIVDVPRIKARMDRWPNGRMLMIPGAKHEILMETEATRKLAFDGMAEFFGAFP